MPCVSVQPCLVAASGLLGSVTHTLKLAQLSCCTIMRGSCCSHITYQPQHRVCHDLSADIHERVTLPHPGGLFGLQLIRELIRGGNSIPLSALCQGPLNVLPLTSWAMSTSSVWAGQEMKNRY